MQRTYPPFQLLGLLLFAAIMGFIGCDSATDDDAFSTEEVSFLYSSLTSELNLTVSQQSTLSASLAQHDHHDRTPGFLWILADSLQKNLTDQQKARLLNRTRSMEGDDDFRGLKGFPGSGGYYGVGGLRGGSGRHGISLLDEVLDLTEDQHTEIKEIHHHFREQTKALMQAYRDGSISNEEFLGQLQALHEAMKEARAAVLTDEQQAALEAVRAEREAAFAAFRAEVLAVRNNVLGLSDDDAEVFDNLFADQLDAREVLLEQFQAGTLNREELRSEIESLRAATEAALRALLTNEQYEVVLIHNALAVRIGRRGHRAPHAGGDIPGGFGSR